jgi:DNA-binding response OmpR family regulator
MNILIVEDEHKVATFLERGLKENGYKVTLSMDGQTGLEMLKKYSFDLLLLDIMLPKLNGIDLLREIKSLNINTPVILLSALGTTENVINGLETGADDYIIKPFSFDELLARINAVNRRTLSKNASDEATILKLYDVELDDGSKQVFRSGKPINLTVTEYNLLKYLMKNHKRVLSRQQLLNHVWGIDFDLSTNVVDVYINYLRKKLEKYGGTRLIQTVIGMGYSFRKREE